MDPSSATKGFFQEYPTIPNLLDGDNALQYCLKTYLPGSVAKKIHPDLHRIGSLAISKPILDLVDDIEHHPPYLQDSPLGHPPVLKTSYGWKEMKKISASEGFVAIAYEREFGEYSRVYQFAKYLLFSASSAMFFCPLAMTDGAARVCELQKKGCAMLGDAYQHLTTRDPNTFWTSGQWMTERTGGSDVSSTSTIATESSDHYSVSGYKFFSSATDSEMSLLLARTTKGLSLFYANMFTDTTKSNLNGVRVIRLKNKMGTKGLPTAELELENMMAYMVGDEGRGVATIGDMLNITRIHNAFAALSFAQRALAIVKAYAKVRKVFGKTLDSNPLHLSLLAELEIKYTAMLHLGIYTASILGKVECLSGDDRQNAAILLRSLTPIAKALISKESLSIITECLEALGGIGYIEGHAALNIARMQRDAQVLTIWEGTSDVLSSDFVQVIKRNKQSSKVIGSTFQTLVSEEKKNTKSNIKIDGIRRDFNMLIQFIKDGEVSIVQANARKICFAAGNLFAAALLYSSAKNNFSSRITNITWSWINECNGASKVLSKLFDSEIGNLQFIVDLLTTYY